MRLVNDTEKLNLDTEATGPNGPCGVAPCFEPYNDNGTPDEGDDTFGELDFCDVPAPIEERCSRANFPARRDESHQHRVGNVVAHRAQQPVELREPVLGQWLTRAQLAPHNARVLPLVRRETRRLELVGEPESLQPGREVLMNLGVARAAETIGIGAQAYARTVRGEVCSRILAVLDHMGVYPFVAEVWQFRFFPTVNLVEDLTNSPVGEIEEKS